ncbi:hypothetical protein KGD82_02700 [Nocardiopsis eucommiae]|uniref:Uncharacterized protein n=1 Tax=Nocardiopsis eucommiae TaxID=2831970 RepID=A0A975L9F8_9ACTN|nr:hypothetical protein KGD82_02700 [Nocardiopsis eucommiae]
MITFGAADEKILTPLSFVFSLVLAAAPSVSPISGCSRSRPTNSSPCWSARS